MPSVSVIIPNYNHEKFLSERIESVLNQTFADFELILLDDCSPDNSRQILQSYKMHPKVSHIVFNDINSGSTFKQWKKGVDLAEGKYIWIAESDDKCSPDFLKSIIPVMEDNPEVVMAFCQSRKIDESGNELDSMLSHTTHIKEFDWTKDFICNGDTFNLYAMSFSNSIPNASGVITRKEPLKEILQEPVPFRLNGDWYIWIKLISKESIAYLSEELNYFRFHSLTVRTKFQDFRLVIGELAKIQNELFRQTQTITLKKTQEKIITWWMYGNALDNKVNWKTKIQNFKDIKSFSPNAFSILLKMFVKDKLLILKLLKLLV